MEVGEGSQAQGYGEADSSRAPYISVRCSSGGGFPPLLDAARSVIPRPGLVSLLRLDYALPTATSCRSSTARRSCG